MRRHGDRELCPSCGRHFYELDTSRHGMCRWCEDEHDRQYLSPQKLFESRAVVCVETEVMYESAAKAGASVGISRSLVSRAARNGWKAGGYHWVYLEEWNGETKSQG